MQLAVVFIGLSIFLFIVALLSNLGRRSEQTKRRLAAIRRPENVTENEELRLPLRERLLRPLVTGLRNSLGKLIRKNNGQKSSKNREKVQRLLAGADVDLSYEAFSGLKLVCTLGAGVAGAVLAGLSGQSGSMLALFPVMGLAVGCWAPTYVLSKKAAARNASILRDLPDVMDLLVVSVEAGLGLDAAIARLYEKEHSPLLNELMGTVRDVQMGLPRRESLKAMADRSQVSELKTFATSIIQAEQLGVSIRNVLRSQAQQLRQSYRQRCEAKAMKAPVKILIPMVIFIFPVLFIILLGPSMDKISGLF